jgi:hypothetical protein
MFGMCMSIYRIIRLRMCQFINVCMYLGPRGYVNRNISVGIVGGYGMDVCGSITGRGKKFSLLDAPAQLPNGYRWRFPPGGGGGEF